MNASSAPAAKPGGGSETRVRVHKVDTRWDGIEHASLAAAAQTAGLTKGGYIRALVLGCPGPRSQRAPSINAVALAQATAALNKVASNINQIARVLNSGGSNVTTRECFLAISEVRLAVASILNAVGRESHP
jgi:methionine synthase I (cobalamin-dependent)